MRITSASLMALALLACGPTDEKDPTPDAGDNTEDTPLYLVHSAVETGGTRSNYFTIVEDLNEVKTLDYSKSIELAGRPRLYAGKGSSFFAIGSGESPTITRYEVVDGELVAGDSVSFQGLGVTSLGAQAVLFISETKPYYKDDRQAQVIVWNPSEMAIEKTIKLPTEIVKEGWLTSLSAWAAREGEAYIVAGWQSAQYDRVGEGSLLIRLDTATDELTTSTDDRCRGISKTALVGEDLYFFSGVINGLGYTAYEDGGQADCIFKISKGQKTFDGDYLGSAAEALGEGHIGTAVSVSEDGKIWYAVADLEITPNGPGTTYSQWYSAGWGWYTVPLASLDKATKVDTEPGAYSSFTLTAGEDFFVSQSSSDYSTTTLMNLSSGTPTAGISFTGFVLDVARIR